MSCGEEEGDRQAEEADEERSRRAGRQAEEASSVRTAYEQRVRTRTNNEPGINYKLISSLISIAIGTGVYSRGGR